MSLFDQIRNAVVDVVNAAVNFTRDALVAVADAFAQIGHDLLSVSEYFRTALEAKLGAILPEEVARWVTISWYFIEAQVQLGVAAIDVIAGAIKTGRIDDLIVPYKSFCVAALRQAQKEASHGALPLPENILCLIPNTQDRKFIQECRYTVIDKIDDRRFLEVWRSFTDQVAITLIDVIVFPSTPNFQRASDMFLAVHECKHLLQFRDKGVEAMVSDYMDDVIGGRRPRRLETAADVYACSIVHGTTPHYIGKCPESDPA